MTTDQIEDYKSQCRYRIAGQLAALLGCHYGYGCHYGMRSTRDAAVDEYRTGYQEITELFEREKGA